MNFHSLGPSQVNPYGLDTQKEGNRTQLRLADLIMHRDKPQTGALGNSATYTEQSQKITPGHTLEAHEFTPETELGQASDSMGEEY